MKEKLIIENFLTIDYLEIDVNKITILIGEQSTSKSIVSKLFYLCEKFLEGYKQLYNNYFDSVIEEFIEKEYEGFATHYCFHIYMNCIYCDISKVVVKSRIRRGVQRLSM